MIRSSKLANYMQCRDLNNFWKEIAIRNKSKSTQSNRIAGISVETDLANLWKYHYYSLSNSPTNITDKDVVCTTCSFKDMCF